MRTYSYVALVVDGKETSKLEVYGEHNNFNIFEYDENVFSGGYNRAMEFINAWKDKQSNIKEWLESIGMTATFEQTIS